MWIEGSCSCHAVRFRVDSTTPVPYQDCYCSICRKTAGGSGSAVAIMADKTTLVVEGEQHVGTYRAELPDPERPGQTRTSSFRRCFCTRCGSALWGFNPEWGELVYPVASAVDTELPTPSERVHVFVDSRASWVRVPQGAGETCFAEHPDESIAGWHAKRGLAVSSAADGGGGS
jgi:hypothetical protein